MLNIFQWHSVFQLKNGKQLWMNCVGSGHVPSICMQMTYRFHETWEAIFAHHFGFTFRRFGRIWFEISFNVCVWLLTAGRWWQRSRMINLQVINHIKYNPKHICIISIISPLLSMHRDGIEPIAWFLHAHSHSNWRFVVYLCERNLTL